MRGYTLDTSIISSLFQRKKEVRRQLANRIAGVSLAGTSITISALVYYETRRGLVAARLEKEVVDFEEFCRAYDVLPCDLPILDRACDLYRYLKENYGSPTGKDVDLIIAATGLVRDMVVVTANTRDFERIPGLKLENWIEGM